MPRRWRSSWWPIARRGRRHWRWPSGSSRAGGGPPPRPPPPPLPARAAPPPLAPVSLADLVRAVRRRLLALPAEPAPAALAPVVSLTDTIAAIEAILARDGQTCLTVLLERARSRAEAIVTFIGLLELIRRRRIVAAQAVLFGEILIVAADGAA
jgi:chromatin segregation and condensation protein Rec8/ScpA/Scc1 (kleisin family)